MPNKKFTVSGDEDDVLKHTIDLIFIHRGVRTTKVESWKVVEGVGLALYWSSVSPKEVNKFPVALDAAGVYPIVSQWLETEEAKNMIPKSMQMGDGSYNNGWEISNYGKEPNSFYQVLVVKPIEIYYGK